MSDSPIVFDRTRWKAVLLNYVIDDEHVIDSNDPKQVERLDELVNIKDDPTGRELISIEMMPSFANGYEAARSLPTTTGA